MRRSIAEPVTDPLVLGDDLPAAFQSTDRASLHAQHRAVRLTGLQLLLLIASAVGGAVDLRLRRPPLDVGGLVAITGFVAALVVGYVLASSRLDRTWYRGRAGAESVKTLAWRYAAGGEPFQKGLLTDKQASRLFLSRLVELVDQLKELDWPETLGIEQVTERMRDIRRLDLEERKRSYRAGRLDDQIHWYRRKAAENARRSRRWGRVAGLITLAGVLAGVARVMTLIELDLLGVLAAVAASATAWAQLKQFDVLASAYGLTAQQLAIVRSELLDVHTEEEWVSFVSQAEDGMSKEHTLWLTRRGLPG
jgi:SMODS and SLOG-associating 2TM effector domain 3/SMODS and SLOG-associating 2TM effector domain 1